jgi:uncharacterized protein YbcI
VSPPDAGLEGGELNRALANELGRLVAAFTGRGATKSRAFVHHDMAVCLLEDGASRAEANLIVAGRSDLVRLQRDAIGRAMEPQLVASVERLTGRRVATFLSGTSTLGSDSVEVFVLEPLAGVARRREVSSPA